MVELAEEAKYGRKPRLQKNVTVLRRLSSVLSHSKDADYDCAESGVAGISTTAAPGNHLTRRCSFEAGKRSFDLKPFASEWLSALRMTGHK
jgi:hypothetical protein